MQIIHQLIYISKTQLSKVAKLGGFLGRLIRPLLKTDLTLMENVHKSLVKNVLIQLGLTAVLSSAEAGMHKESLDWG